MQTARYKGGEWEDQGGTPWDWGGKKVRGNSVSCHHARRQPHIYILVPWGEHYDVALRTCRERSEDMRTLNHPISIMGMDVVFENSAYLGDTPVHQVP